ncbi:hypothetical protein [Pontimicrobium sp. MEBiC01747]
MRSKDKIDLIICKTDFKQTKSVFDDGFYDNSFAQSKKAIGELRFPSVDNGRYESEHPIMNSYGETIGSLSGARYSLGYTYSCVYVEGCFWIAHERFNRGGCYVSLIEDAGKFFFSKKRNFKVIESFSLDGDWAEFSKAFKLIDNGKFLIYVTSIGFCLFNTKNRTIKSKVHFTRFLSPSSFNFSISPNKNLFAVIASTMRGQKDPIDNEYKYDNFLWIYDLNNGSLIGEMFSEIDKRIKWSIHFNEIGDILRIKSDKLEYLLKLKPK